MISSNRCVRIEDRGSLLPLNFSRWRTAGSSPYQKGTRRLIEDQKLKSPSSPGRSPPFFLCQGRHGYRSLKDQDGSQSSAILASISRSISFHWISPPLPDRVFRDRYFPFRKCRDQDVDPENNVDPQLPALFRSDHLRKIFSVPQDVSDISLIDTAEDFDERGFSGSVLTDETMDLPSPRESPDLLMRTHR